MHGRRTIQLALAALLATGWACNDGSSGPTEGGVADQALAFDEVAASEIVTSGFLEDLTDEQREGLRAAFERAHTGLADIRARWKAGAIDREQAMEEARVAHDRLLEELSALLSSEQIEELRERRRHPPARPDLGLTEEQRQEIRTIWVALHDALERLARRVRAGEIDPAEARALAHEAADRAHAAICDVLSEEQASRVPFCG